MLQHKHRYWIHLVLLIMFVAANISPLAIRPVIAATTGATIVVNTLADDNIKNGNCTLREAITAANTDAKVDECIAGSGADTIRLRGDDTPATFADDLFGSLNLFSPLSIETDMTIDGPGMEKLVLDGQGFIQIFSIKSTATVTIQDLTIKGGFSNGDGGGIINLGVLTVNNVYFVANKASGNGGAIHSKATSLTIDGCTFRLNEAVWGAAILPDFGSGPTTIRNSYFVSNAVHGGRGVIWNTAKATIIASTFLYNDAEPFGATLNTTQDIINSTFFQNNTNAIWNQGNLHIYNSTIVENMIAGIQNDAGNGSVEVFNTIFAKNTPNCLGAGIARQGNGNLQAGDSSCTNVTTVADLKLATSFEDNGGRTPTIALLPDSPAIDKGDAAACQSLVGNLDQRGVTRNQGSSCDSGAYEVTVGEQPGPTLTVNQTTDLFDGVCNDTHCTLREAIILANRLTGDNTIHFSVPAGSTISLISLLPAPQDNTIVDGTGNANLTISGNYQTQIFVLRSGKSRTIVLKNLRFVRGFVMLKSLTPTPGERGEGGAIYSDGISVKTEINNCVFSDNHAQAGGAFYARGSSIITIVDSTFINNDAFGEIAGVNSPTGGGAIGNGGFAVVKILRSTFESNRATLYGAAIVNQGGADVIIESSKFINNQAESHAGAILHTSTFQRPNNACDICNSIFTRNHAGVAGGAVWNSFALNIEASTFYSNTTPGVGGAVATDNPNAKQRIVNSTISGNQSNSGVLTNDGTLTVINSTIANNVVDSPQGSAIDLVAGTITLQNTIIANTKGGKNCFGTVVDGGSNRQFGDNSCGATIPVQDPKLGPLANNGGATQTHALLTGSSAIDNGNDTTCAAIGNKDQRGIARDNKSLSGQHCDIGAYEAVTTFNLTITKNGSGNVVLNPPGGVYAAGTVVQLTANPVTGFTFSGWTGAVTGATNPINVTMDGDKAVTVNFNAVAPQPGANKVFLPLTLR